MHLVDPAGERPRDIGRQRRAAGMGGAGATWGRAYLALNGAELRGRLEAPDPALRLVSHPHHGKDLTKRSDRLVRAVGNLLTFT
jgi:hypothetical protein